MWRVYEASGVRPCLALEGRGTLVDFVDDACLSAGNDQLRRFAQGLAH